MNIVDAIKKLDDYVPHPSEGLPEEVFEYISRTTPLINVDLLVKDDRGRTLLAWRDDRFTGKGWHVPGGIVRFQESLEARIQKVAETEIGTQVRFDPEPIALNQIILPDRTIRGHFISILYKCYLSRDFEPANSGMAPDSRGYLKWHDRCPEDLLTYHEIYKQFL